ncbi:MAG: helix-turn-helix transcriptional regulator [Acidobacteriota bacterium]
MKKSAPLSAEQSRLCFDLSGYVGYDIALPCPPFTHDEGRRHPGIYSEAWKTVRSDAGGLARKVGVTYSTVNHWQNGKRMPLPFLVKRLVEMKEELAPQDTKPPLKTSKR